MFSRTNGRPWACVSCLPRRSPSQALKINHCFLSNPSPSGGNLLSVSPVTPSNLCNELSKHTEKTRTTARPFVYRRTLSAFPREDAGIQAPEEGLEMRAAEEQHGSETPRGTSGGDDPGFTAMIGVQEPSASSREGGEDKHGRVRAEVHLTVSHLLMLPVNGQTWGLLQANMTSSVREVEQMLPSGVT